MDNGFLGPQVSFSIPAHCLKAGEGKEPTLEKWFKFREEFLKNVCAARNTPPSTQLPKSRPDQPTPPMRGWWRLMISLEDPQENFDYVHEFCDKMDDALKNLLSPGNLFSEVYQILRDGNTICVHVSSSRGEVATKDYKTKLSANKGLIDSNSYGMEGICHDLYKRQHEETAIFPRPSDFYVEGLSVGDKIFLSEDSCLQFKLLQPGMKANQKKAPGEIKRFNPTKGQDYVDWIWDSSARGLGEYISAFTKNQRGGAIYYGMKETADHSGYLVEGLCLDAEMMQAIRKGICEKVRHGMLWIKRNLKAADGYEELTSQKIHCLEEKDNANDTGQFAVDFIKVAEKNETSQGTGNAGAMGVSEEVKASGRGRLSSGSHIQGTGKVTGKSDEAKTAQGKYILEVRVAPFQGVVFYDPHGPEAYRMQETTPENFEPVRLTKTEWLAEMSGYGWCAKHKSMKEKVCKQCLSELNRAN